MGSKRVVLSTLFFSMFVLAQEELVEQDVSDEVIEEVVAGERDHKYRAPSDGYYEQHVQCDCSDPRFVLRNKEMSLIFSGYIKSNNFFDTRQVFGFYEDLRLIVPEPRMPDINGRDVNARAQFNMLAIETRLRTLMIGPKIGRARPFGFIEVDFTGPWLVNNSTNQHIGFQNAINCATLRHAYIRLQWDRFSFLAGQFWHPMVPPESAVNDTVSFETTPFQSVARNPQLRLTTEFSDRAELIVAAISQLQFVSNGPEGFSSKYLSNALVPNLHAQLRTYWGDHVLGAAVDFKRLLPLLFTEKDGLIFKANNTVSAVSGQVYGQLKFDKIVARAFITYASNLTDHLLLGGYGVSSVDSCGNRQTYTPMRQLAFLFDMYAPLWLEPGIMIGATKNLGARGTLYRDPTMIGNEQFTIYGLGGGGDGLSQNFNAIDYVIGVAPRLKWYKSPITFGAEVKWLRAGYGELNCKGRIHDICPVNDVRITLALYYCF
jgi:hypothetical protein